jgi:hypothetical protein
MSLQLPMDMGCRPIWPGTLCLVRFYPRLGTYKGTYMRCTFLFLTPPLSNQHSGGVKRAPEAIPSMNRPIRNETERRQDCLEIWSMSGQLVERI